MKINNNDFSSEIKNKSGIDIEEMKRAAKQGNMEDFLNKNLSKNATNQLKNILSSKEATEKLLSSPQAKELMKKLTKGQ